MKANKLDALLFPGANGAAIAARPGYPTVIVPFGWFPRPARDAATPTVSSRVRPQAAALRRQLHRHGVQRADAAQAGLRASSRRPKRRTAPPGLR